MYRTDWEGLRVSSEISRDLHGGNFVATANSISPGDSSAAVIDTLSFSSIRFPGGDVTERYLSPTEPTWLEWISSEQATISLPNGRQFASLQSFINHASDQNLQISIVLPTEGLLIRNPDGTVSVDQEALDQVVEFACDLVSGRYGDITIRQFEIGNEYYMNGRMSGAEYGLVANEMVESLGRALDEIGDSRPHGLFNEPDILVQAGPPWRGSDNETIINSLSPEAREYVDGVIIHWYPRNLAGIDNLNNNFETIDAWQAADGFIDLDLHVTEWNIFNSPAADTGFYQASTLLESYERLAIQEISSADIWGTSFPRLLTRLAVPGEASLDDPGFRLTPAGEVVRSLFATTADLHVLELSIDHIVNANFDLGEENIDYTLASFGDANRAVVYISSRSDEALRLELDIDKFFGDAHHVVVQTFELHDDPTTSVNEASPGHAPYAQVVTRTYTRDELAELLVELGPGEIARIEYIMGEVGVHIEGQIGSPVPGISYADTLVGTTFSDTLLGYQGDDLLYGGGGRDILDGGSGNDHIYGGGGHDLIMGDSGDDILSGASGSDVILGGTGNDKLQGGNHADLLFGGEGNNTLRGESGDDTLIATGDDDVLYGGEGGDTFSISTAGNSVIEDWSHEDEDLISFQGQYESPDHVRERMVEVHYSDNRPGDLIIEHDGGTSTTIRGAAGQQDAVIDRLFDHQPLALNTLAQANLLTIMTPAQVRSVTEAMGTEEYDAYRSAIDPTLLAQNLDGERLSSFLNGMDGIEAQEFIRDIPESDRHELLSEMEGLELNSFLSNLGYDQMVALLSSISNSHLVGLSHSFDDNTTRHINDLMARFFSDLESLNDHPEDSALDDLSWLQGLQSSPGSPPLQTTDDEELEREEPNAPEAPSGETSAGCFVATAVYADPNHPDVWLLRWYRDEVLRSCTLGRLFIAVYWVVGPRIAETVSKYAFLVNLFLSIIRFIVLLICRAYSRKPGKQFDHIDYPDSRYITIGVVAKEMAKRREER
ncbi:calcium-binding protein [Pseudotabrizicola alkalilacus]|uniref:Calcium-binding protein n=1 Tax=Pseudotabrizicola alkalilacus TaxID=2305252 RepID=A0A411YWU1_9RHOB|nr:CFI-box-CTERM domain-containing protein [Pseudotabrizicola alkalilacus]RGP35203.1 calcium-binding protein [Pseudotabrizicola alkalilacus]